jgi:hypothetical protein
LRITERLLNTRDNTQPKQESMSKYPQVPLS